MTMYDDNTRPSLQALLVFVSNLCGYADNQSRPKPVSNSLFQPKRVDLSEALTKLKGIKAQIALRLERAKEYARRSNDMS